MKSKVTAFLLIGLLLLLGAVPLAGLLAGGRADVPVFTGEMDKYEVRSELMMAAMTRVACAGRRTPPACGRTG